MRVWRIGVSLSAVFSKAAAFLPTSRMPCASCRLVGARHLRAAGLVQRHSASAEPLVRAMSGCRAAAWLRARGARLMKQPLEADGLGVFRSGFKWVDREKRFSFDVKLRDRRHPENTLEHLGG